MAAPTRHITPLMRGLNASIRSLPTRSSRIPLPLLCPIQQQQQTRRASTAFMAQERANRAKAKAAAPGKKRKTFKLWDMKDAITWSLCDAMRYLRAAEVGRPSDTVKYELHIRLKTRKNGAVVRNTITLPHPFHREARICVICPPGSKAAKQAADAGADLIGEAEVFEQIKAGNINFDKCICHTDSQQAMNKAQLGRILGPKGLMPSAKMGTVTENIAGAVQSMRVGMQYRERLGVIRMGIGRLGFSPEQLRDNMRAFIGQVKKDMAAIADDNPKDIVEVVLSSTNGPAFTLNGNFRSEDSPPTEALRGP